MFVDKGAVGILLVVLLYAPSPIGVADVAELRTARSYGVVIYLAAVVSLATQVTKAGIASEVGAFMAGSLDGMDPVLQYCVISWSIAALTIPTNEVLASVMGAAVWLEYATAATYAGPLTPLRVALACCVPGSLVLTPTHCPPVVVGLAMSKPVGGIESKRLYAMLAIQSVIEIACFYPLSATIIASVPHASNSTRP